jgi:hypothetical protein
MLYMGISRVVCEKQAEHKKKYVGKMQIYFCFTRYQAAYFKPVGVTVIYRGLIQLSYASQT